MSSIGPIFTRTTNLMSSDNLLAAIQRTSEEISRVQQEIATGRTVDRPSDDPAKLAAILALRETLEARDQYDRNLQHATGVLNAADGALADVSDILIEARSIALSQIGIGSGEATRESEASVIDAQLASLIEIANRLMSGVGLFTGSHQGDDEGRSFVSFLGGVLYTGGLLDLQTDGGLDEALSFNINGNDAFNIQSGRIEGQIDLDPFATQNANLTDVEDAQGRGVRLGTIVVTVDGNAASIDLSDAQTLGDVVTRVNDAIQTVDPAAGSLSIVGGGYELTANLGHIITIGESGNGETAGDLGIDITASSTIVAGADLNPQLTELTDLTQLGASVDLISGLKITQAGLTKVADFSGAQTVQDMMNVIDQLNMGLKLVVSEDGSGLDIVNLVSGADLSIGENGGSTAEDLGLRTFGTYTKLSVFNSGDGVSSIAVDNDFEIRLHDGSSFQINLDGITTVGELITEIGNQATAAGLVVGSGGDFNVGLATDGNGLLLEDFTVGANAFEVESLGESLAAADLGINKQTSGGGSGGAISGDDVAQRRVDSIFTFLIELRDSLAGNDSPGISVAEGNLVEGIDLLSRTRAEVGLRAQRAEQEQERSSDMRLSEQSVLSGLQDADLTEVITRFTQLQTQLQASLQVGAQNLQLSLLNFLR